MKLRSIFHFIITSLFKKNKYKEKEVITVPDVNIERYMGTWYEISSYPQWFEKGLTDVSANYTALDGYVDIVNSGYRDGKRQVVHGKAKVVKNSGNAKLKVSFFRPFYGKYWIIDLSSDYFWAVISNPTRSTLWILCRNRTINHQLYHSILERVKTNGFDISKLVKMESHLLLSGKNFTCDV